MAKPNRPLSPHLQVYRWGLHMVLSILHRATGVALGVGTLLLAWWLISLASGPEAFAQAQSCLSSWLGRLVLFGFTWALMLHLCNGIRHLVWDTGQGYDLDAVRVSNFVVLGGSVVLTLAAWIFAYCMLGGA
ncbi:succinate dehydrogenase, cytochrome b556 subunit [Govanella unica]|uniref:Succinate dehydrogenase cytochrome b556 subunit n=1 Tax=Govanella unica TaxID=2975056 RepID=A0A9X3Z623_9PROT|nr:succinate dehydrogenase, cytochrome b556 subunit [Govania unica]MDA5192735.1 succinate dehydrogenase, cytochrome b556 subunit [Govania unica]